jgi:hypothetical protein
VNRRQRKKAKTHLHWNRWLRGYMRRKVNETVRGMREYFSRAFLLENVDTEAAPDA